MTSKTIKLASLSVFFPCLNEDKNIIPLIKKFETVLPQIAHKYEIVIIDDGSTDNTGKIARRLAQQNKCVRVIHHPKNLGYGASLKSGFNNVNYDWVFYTDGDLQFNPEHLIEFIPFTHDYQAIIGYRSKRADGQLRALNAYLFKLFIDAIFRVHVKDIDCAFKLFKTDLIRSIKLQSTGAMISAELLYRLKKKKIKFKQIPVGHYPRKFGKPTGNNPKVVLKAGMEALRLYLNIKFGLGKIS